MDTKSDINTKETEEVKIQFCPGSTKHQIA